MPYVLSAINYDKERGKAEGAAAKVRSMLAGAARSVDVEGGPGYYYVAVRIDAGVTITSLPDKVDGVPVKVTFIAVQPPVYYEPYYGGAFGPWPRGRIHHRPHHRRHHP